MAATTQHMPQAPSSALDKSNHVVSQTNITLATELPELKALLSSEAKIILPSHAEYETRISRFSEYKRPTPGAVVCPATEADLAATVKWATSNDIRFLARAGGHGWSMTLSQVGPEGILISLRDMNRITVDLKSGCATLGAGATTGELLKAAQNADAHIVATACDSVGAVPSIMGGGIGNLVSNYGLGSDNIISARLVTATGNVVTTSATENADLFWALRGAGHNFGIPTVLLKLSLNGSTEAAMAAFAPLYALADTYTPNINTGELMPADEINEAKDSLCSEGGNLPRAYRPVHSASLEAVDPEIMGALYERWENFTAQNEGAKQTVVRVNFYDYRRVREIPVEDSAFAWRKNPINVLQYWAYTDESMEQEIQSLGQEFRNALNGAQSPNVVMSFATGDENPSYVYGKGLDRIREVKNKWDPQGVFSYYNSC
ncbi:FAD-binding domain-containing protein [Pseudovirgaria hyperparasitica]|uniref:FAD-binding domain-containing protein n=1 Tax=Pseudovirgaria hyperparasitica TaxID=470096 RepID=A0A6A6W5A6_9PEZI|nr:FAD-binding domain-containing protein [Pseudovirgaria hyperparasitica]KAF2756241.1 FAD-binding domain-containing protein [Pseudovirgaria hyperparasitica]